MKTDERHKQAVLYSRYSPRPNSADCESIPFQFERLRAWCLALEYEVLAEYSDEDRSGKTTAGRAGLRDAIAHACKARAVLCVYSLSRLARNTRDAIEIAERLKRHRADLASLHERIDTTSPMGRLYYTLTAALAQLEREQIVERTSDAMRRHQANGRRMGRIDRCPYGHRPSAADPKALEEAPEELATIRRMTELRAAGTPYREICRILDEEGRPRRGKKWAGVHHLVAKILRREGVD